jgi:excisionase family DNA binding protein
MSLQNTKARLHEHSGTHWAPAPEGNGHMSDIVRLNSIKEIVVRTGLSRSKIYEEMAGGHLLSVKVGSRRLIPESALIDFIDGLIKTATIDRACAITEGLVAAGQHGKAAV